MKNPNGIKWTRLDNASKIFPATFSVKDTKVFRFTCELNEKVEQDILQEALNITIEDFPLYKSVLRRGMFWYYFESSDLKPVVQIESYPVCAPIYIGQRDNLLFRVFYYNKRINFEIFHALSDGTGALWFMQSLVYHYLKLKHKEIFANTISPYKNISISRQMDDSFGKHFIGGNIFNLNIKSRKKQHKIRAYHIRGTRAEESRTMLIEGSMSVNSILELVNKYNTTVTIFIASLYIYSVYKEMPARTKKHSVVLSVPINLRQFFESVTARNFFSTVNVGYNFEKGTHDLKSVIEGISASFKRDLTVEQLNQQLNQLMSLERNPFARVIPLQFKDYVLRIVSKSKEREITSNISNMGQISMPSEFNPFIRQFSVCTGAGLPKATLCSFDDRMVISFTSPFRETDIQRAFFQELSKQGIKIQISSNF